MSTLKMGTATLATENAGSIDINSGVTFPAGHVIQTSTPTIFASTAEVCPTNFNPLKSERLVVPENEVNLTE